MSKKLQIGYAALLLLIGAAAAGWFAQRSLGAPELADGTPLVALAQWPAGWPKELQVVGGAGVWAGKLDTALPSGTGRQLLAGEFFLEEPLESVAQNLKLALEANFGRVSTLSLTRDGLPVEGFTVYPRPEQRAALGFTTATVTASPVARGRLRKNPGQRIETVVTIQRLASSAAAGARPPAGAR